MDKRRHGSHNGDAEDRAPHLPTRTPGAPFRVGLLIAVLALVLAVVSGCGGDSGEDQSQGSDESSSAASGSEDDRTAMIERVKPSVVAVTTVPKGQGRSTDEGAAHSHGSGVVYDAKKGLILTSNHFVEQAVSLSVDVNGREVQGRPVARAQCNDLTLIRLRPRPPSLTAIKFGNSARVKSGEDVVALGYLRPPGSPAPQFISTNGAVSAVGVPGEVHPELPAFPSLLLFQAPLRPAMSGGPVVNTAGEMVGLSTFIDTGQGGPTTQAPFNAVTSNQLDKLLSQLKPTKTAVYSGWYDQHECHHAMAALTEGSYVKHGSAHKG
jgi:S1-C subfamily serine protease